MSWMTWLGRLFLVLGILLCFSFSVAALLADDTGTAVISLIVLIVLIVVNIIA